MAHWNPTHGYGATPEPYEEPETIEHGIVVRDLSEEPESDSILPYT
jgi:hypothetical protein